MSEDKDYAHMRDPEAQRTRAELWAIMVIVAVVVVGALIWRVVAHKPASPEKGYVNAQQYPDPSAAPAAAGVRTSPPAPHPVAP